MRIRIGFLLVCLVASLACAKPAPEPVVTPSKDFAMSQFHGFEATSIDGKPVRLSEYAGKIVHLESNLPELLGTDAVKWNFTKFLMDRQGNVVRRFESPETPESIEAEITQLLAKR